MKGYKLNGGKSTPSTFFVGCPDMRQCLGTNHHFAAYIPYCPSKNGNNVSDKCKLIDDRPTKNKMKIEGTLYKPEVTYLGYEPDEPISPESVQFKWYADYWTQAMVVGKKNHKRIRSYFSEFLFGWLFRKI